MRVGISLSPGGLLLPYHVGVLDGLKHVGYVDSNGGGATAAIAGASAGAIAAAAHACEIDSRRVVDAAIDISDRTKRMGGARGNLLPLLREKLHDFIDEEQFQIAKTKPLAIAYREIFPVNRAVHQTHFEHRHDLIDAVCHSSMFPFFSTNWPVTLCTAKTKIPRVLVDGFFAVPRSRFGCPDFDLANGIDDLDETVMVSVFPKELIGLNVPRHYDDDSEEVTSSGDGDNDKDKAQKVATNKASHPHYCISPQLEEDTSGQLERLFRLATQSSSAKELYDVYESGFEDAERWYFEHEERLRNKKQKQTNNRNIARLQLDVLSEDQSLALN